MINQLYVYIFFFYCDSSWCMKYDWDHWHVAFEHVNLLLMYTMRTESFI